jgi:acetolactate synthase I/II/III large subunit
MIKLSDYVARFLVDKGIHDIFLVSGGGIMHLIDSVGRTQSLRYICNYHEQACAIAAESYARTTNSIGACLVTTGPGSTNALSGIAGAWVDSIPVIVISGQVRRDLIADYARLRQFGPQEINVIDMARPVTKYATTVMEPEMIRYELEAAYAHATSGRPGPVWVNIPLDVQGEIIDELNLPAYSQRPIDDSADVETRREQVRQVIQMIQQAKRPILILGNGVRLAHAEQLIEKFVPQLGIPVIATIGGMDLMDENHPLNMGRFGPIGQRRANFALQNSDLLIGLGASMSVASIGFNTAGFAPNAKKIMVNIDTGELTKSNLTSDLAVQADVSWFIEEFLRQAEGVEFGVSPKWLNACEHWKKNYPIITPDYLDDREHVNSYVFASILSDLLAPHDVVVTGNSLDIVSIYHSFKVKLGQRIFTNINFGAMGWDLPAAVGACVAHGNQRTILVTGDGSFQFNVQELETIRVNQLNVKIFVLNNDGYESIRATQNNYFEGRFVGADPKSGIGNPDFAKLAEAYGLGYEHIMTNDEIRVKTASVLQRAGPMLCELNLSYHQGRSPKTSSYRREDGTLESRPLEDMYPFLPREEIARNMHMFDANERDQNGA